MDPLTKRNEEIQQWVDAEDGTLFHIHYFLIGTAPLLSDRDFIYALKEVKESPTVSYIVLTSIDGPSRTNYEPPKSFHVDDGGAVRANNIFVAQRYEELPNGDLKVSYSTLSNPCGWIPNTLTNQFLHQQPMKMLDMAKLVGKVVKAVCEE